MSEERKIAHLGFIQDVINRMGNNSFLIKGWVIALVAAMFALSAKEANSKFGYLVILPVLVFWGYDGYFLYQERLYRWLYSKVADETVTSAHYTMDALVVAKDKGVGAVFSACLSKTLLPFYAGVIIAVWFFICRVLP